FFFSSRRRHTRFSRDWSSDVCSSDLAGQWRRIPEGAWMESLITPLFEGAPSSGSVVEAAADTAVERDNRSVQEWDLTFSQRQGEARDFLRGADASGRMALGQPAELFRLPREPRPQHVGLDGGRLDAVDPDATPQLHRHRAGQSTQCRLARRIGDEARLGQPRMDAADVEHRPAGTVQFAEERLCPDEWGNDVDVQRRSPVLAGEGLHG